MPAGNGGQRSLACTENILCVGRIVRVFHAAVVVERDDDLVRIRFVPRDVEPEVPARTVPPRKSLIQFPQHPPPIAPIEHTKLRMVNPH